MLTNKMLQLSGKQRAQYHAWASKIAAAFADEECQKSLEIRFAFYFSVLGRSVEARVSDSLVHRLVPENAF